MLCDDLEEWDGDGGEREAQEGGGICIYIIMADSCCSTAETNTTLCEFLLYKVNEPYVCMYPLQVRTELPGYPPASH